jgi:branched-chain amino acid transport system substrate-binding protein
MTTMQPHSLKQPPSTWRHQDPSLTRKRWAGIIILILLGVAAGAATAQPTQKPIRIGEVNPLSGKLAMHGQEIHQGIVYAVEEINAGGGLQGRPVELISRDDQSQPDVATNQTQELILRERVVGLVGGYVDSLVGPISEVAATHHTPYVASASLQGALTRERRNPYFFRVSRLDGVVIPLCQFIKTALRPRCAAIIYSATPGSTEFAGDVKACLEAAGIAVVVVDKFRPGASDFSPLLLKLRMNTVDVVVSGGFYPDHLVLLRQLRNQHTPLKAYLGPWGIAYQSLIDELGDVSEHVFGTCAWNPGITTPGTEQESQAFVTGFQKRFGQPPNTTTMHGYSSARALLTAVHRVIQQSSDPTGDAIRRELAQLDLNLPMERLQFDQQGDPLNYRQVVVQIQHGQMVVVYPPDRATGQVIYPGR